jgi:C4-dicarboxylate transporter DctQ subunit
MRNMWNHIEQTLAGVLGLAALAFAVWQVVSRYFLQQNSISYAEEAIVYLMIWAIMIVSSQLVRMDSHVRPDLVLKLASPRVTYWLEMFNHGAAVVFCGALVWYAWQVVEMAWLIDEHSASDLRFPMWIYYAALPVGGLLMAIRYAIGLARLVLGRSPAPARHAGAHELPGLD